MKTTTQELIELYSTMLRERGRLSEFRENNGFDLDHALKEMFNILIARLKAENE